MGCSSHICVHWCFFSPITDSSEVKWQRHQAVHGDDKTFPGSRIKRIVLPCLSSEKKHGRLGLFSSGLVPVTMKHISLSPAASDIMCLLCPTPGTCEYLHWTTMTTVTCRRKSYFQLCLAWCKMYGGEKTRGTFLPGRIWSGHSAVPLVSHIKTSSAKGGLKGKTWFTCVSQSCWVFRHPCKGAVLLVLRIQHTKRHSAVVELFYSNASCKPAALTQNRGRACKKWILQGGKADAFLRIHCMTTHISLAKVERRKDLYCPALLSLMRIAVGTQLYLLLS